MDYVASTDKLIDRAIAERATDIHIEPVSREKAQVRFRIDGRLIPMIVMPRALYQGVLSRLKVLSGMDIAESRYPQDGNITLIDKSCPGCRAATMPTIHGEKMVLRLLPDATQNRNAAALGLTPEQESRLRQLFETQRGMILVCGPTGSGKTTTLYQFMRMLSDSATQIISLEDPVEMTIPGIVQVRVSENGLTTEKALRAVLRQDPDRIIIGELRDEKVAAMAIRAAMTGHQVFSTLHTRDALSTVVRLGEMGLPAWQIADVLSAVVAQRLVRRICPHCKTIREPSEAEKQIWTIPDGVPVYYGEGCDHCHQTGYFDRIGVFELLECSDALKTTLHDGMRVSELRQIVQPDSTMKMQVRQLILQGITTVEEGRPFV